MEKSPDERPFLAIFKLQLASANYMATPLKSPYDMSADTSSEASADVIGRIIIN